jgi:hypothetical protein
LLILLSSLGQLAHGSQAAGTDIHCTLNTIDFNTTSLDVQHKAASRAFLRKIDIIAMHRLAFANFTTTRHRSLPLYSMIGPAKRPLKLPLIIKPASDILQMFRSLLISFSLFDEKLSL